MKIIKKETGIVEVTDAGVILQTLQPVASLSLVDGNDGVRATDVNGRIFDFFTRSIDQLQIDPAAPTAFAGDTQDLIEVLEADFFNSVPSGGGSGDNIYTTDGTITDATRTVQGDGSNFLVFQNFAAAGFVSAPGSSIVAEQEIQLDTGATGSNIYISSGSDIAMTLYSSESFATQVKHIITSNIAPSAAVYLTGAYLWYSELEQELYFYDTAQSKWLSVQLYNIAFGDQGNTGNGVFLRSQGVQTSLTEGYPLTYRLNAFAFKYNNIRELSNQSYVFYRGNTAIITQAIPSDKVGFQSITPVTIQPFETLACQHLGATNEDAIVDLQCRKEYIDFLLTSVSVVPLGGGDYELNVNFIGGDITLIQNIEWNYEEPFSGPDPNSNPVSLNEQSAGVWSKSPETFDGDPTGETYDVTLTFTGIGGYSRQESVTVTIQ